MACIKCAQARSAAFEAARKAAQGNLPAAKQQALLAGRLVQEKFLAGRKSRLGR